MSQNETPMYLVPGRLTDEQKLVLQKHVDAYDFDGALASIGTPIQPCADVETVTGPDDWCPLIRRVDMAAQIAVRDMDIECLRADMETQASEALIRGLKAEIRDRDAEIARLLAKQPLHDRVVHENGELKRAVALMQAQDDKALTQVIEERDECEQVISDLYHAAMGEYPEWSNNFGYRDAVEDVVDYVHALRKKALNEGAAV